MTTPTSIPFYEMRMLVNWNVDTEDEMDEIQLVEAVGPEANKRVRIAPWVAFAELGSRTNEIMSFVFPDDGDWAIRVAISVFHGSTDMDHWSDGVLPIPSCPATIAMGRRRGLFVRFVSISGDNVSEGFILPRLLQVKRWILAEALVLGHNSTLKSAARPQVLIFFHDKFSPMPPSAKMLTLLREVDEHQWPDSFPTHPMPPSISYVLTPMGRVMQHCTYGYLHDLNKDYSYSDYRPLAGCIEAEVKHGVAARLPIQPSNLWASGCRALQPVFDISYTKLFCSEGPGPVMCRFFSASNAAKSTQALSDKWKELAQEFNVEIFHVRDCRLFDILFKMELAPLSDEDTPCPCLTISMHNLNKMRFGPPAKLSTPFSIYNAAMLYFLLTTTFAHEILLRFRALSPHARAGVRINLLPVPSATHTPEETTMEACMGGTTREVAAFLWSSTFYRPLLSFEKISVDDVISYNT